MDIGIAINNDSGSNDNYNNDGNEYTPVAEVVAEVVAKVLAKGLPLRVKGYIRKALRPNIHFGIHYNDIYEEYSPPGLLNVLVKEKYYK